MAPLLSYLLSLVAWTTLSPAAGTVLAREIDRKHVHALRQEAAERLSKNRLAVPSVEGGVRLSEGVKNFTFSNPAASSTCPSCERFPIHVESWAIVLTGGIIAFYVNGTSIPDVDWDIGPSWAGLLPISGNANETRQVGRLSEYSLWALR